MQINNIFCSITSYKIDNSNNNSSNNNITNMENTNNIKAVDDEVFKQYKTIIKELYIKKEYFNIKTQNNYIKKIEFNTEIFNANYEDMNEFVQILKKLILLKQENITTNIQYYNDLNSKIRKKSLSINNTLLKLYKEQEFFYKENTEYDFITPLLNTELIKQIELLDSAYHNLKARIIKENLNRIAKNKICYQIVFNLTIQIEFIIKFLLSTIKNKDPINHNHYSFNFLIFKNIKRIENYLSHIKLINNIS